MKFKLNIMSKSKKKMLIREFINVSKDIYEDNIDSVKNQLVNIYSRRKISTSWSPHGFIGVEVNGKMFKNQTTYDILLNTKVKIK